MSEYIKREDALAVLEKHKCDSARTETAIRNLLAADVAEVKHGKWEVRTVRGEAELYCSVCGNSPNVIYEYEFCPSCGAKMNLEG